MSARSVQVHKAEPFPGMVVGDCHIDITELMPQLKGDVGAQHLALYLDDAATLEKALHNHLPGGTYDRLLGRMLSRKASLLRVPFLANDHEHERIGELEQRVNDCETAFTNHRLNAHGDRG